MFWTRLRFVLLALLLSCAACSLRKTVWDNADGLAMMRLDRYVHLSEEQEEVWRPKIAAAISRLKREAGPELVGFLNRVRDSVLGELTEYQVAALYRQLDDLRMRHLGSTTGDAAELLAALEPAQVEHLRQHLAESRAKHNEEDAALDDKAHAKQRAKRARERVERFYGPLTDAQAEAVAAVSDLSRQSQLDHRAQSQEAQESLLALLGEKRSKEEIRTQLDQWVKDPETLRTTERGRALVAEERRKSIQKMAAVHHLMTTEQRKKLADELEQWARDLAAWLKEAEQ